MIYIRQFLLLAAAMVVLACDGGGMARLDSVPDALVGTWTLHDGTAEAFITTRTPERILHQGEGRDGIEVSGLGQSLRYVEYHRGGEVGANYEVVHHQITLRSHPLGHSNDAPICSLHLWTSERVWGGSGASALQEPSLSFSCQEDARGERWSNFDLPVETAPTFDFDSQRFVVDLPATTLVRVSTDPSTLGDEITLQGRFQGTVLEIPAGVPTQVPMSFSDATVTPLGTRVTLSSDGTYESVSPTLSELVGGSGRPIVERGRWWVEGNTFTMDPLEIEGLNLDPAQLPVLSARYEQSGRALRLAMDVNPCEAAPDRAECLAIATGSFQFKSQDAATDLRFALTLFFEREGL